MRIPRKVYSIRHNVTGRVYIGSSAHVEERYKNHMYALKSHRHLVGDMQEDFDKFGDNFTFTVLDEISSYEERHKEYDWMEKFSSYKRGTGYNYNDRHVMEYLKRKEEGIPINKPQKPKPQKQTTNGLTDNEEKLIGMIRTSKDPVVALMKAYAVVVLFLAGAQTKTIMNNIQ